MRDRTGFFGKNPHLAKMTENCQKWSKNMVFGLFRKITLLVLSKISVKWSCYGSSTFCKNPMLGKNLVLNLQPKMSLGQWDFSILYPQYFTNRWISDFDFWHVNRHEWKKQGSLADFLKKIIIWGNGPFWA